MGYTSYTLIQGTIDNTVTELSYQEFSGSYKRLNTHYLADKMSESSCVIANTTRNMGDYCYQINTNDIINDYELLSNDEKSNANYNWYSELDFYYHTYKDYMSRGYKNIKIFYGFTP
jgi:hypothetical protein